MEITDVHVKLIRNSSDRLKAVCTITFDEEFVVRDVKVVEGTNGMFVAMPSRKLSIHCKSCNHKNHLRSKYCNDCGAKIDSKPLPSDNDGRTRLHRDIAHPITPAFRERVQERVIKAYEAEQEISNNEAEQDNINNETEQDNINNETEQENINNEVELENSNNVNDPSIKEEIDKDTSKGSDFDDYDEIIASLKGAQKKEERQDPTEASDRSSSDEYHSDKSTSSDVDSDDDEKPVSTIENVESTSVVNQDHTEESISQASTVDADDDGAFGEGIL